MQAIIPPQSSEEFASMAMSLIRMETRQELYTVADKMRIQWPNSCPWLDWWLHTDAAKTLFQSTRRMPNDVAITIPSTTNAQEALHRQYYMTSSKKQSILTG